MKPTGTQGLRMRVAGWMLKTEHGTHFREGAEAPPSAMAWTPLAPHAEAQHALDCLEALIAGTQAKIHRPTYDALCASGAIITRAQKAEGELEIALKIIADQQATIDRLMLEHCPGEMTQSQMRRWARHQRVASAGASR